MTLPHPSPLPSILRSAATEDRLGEGVWLTFTLGWSGVLSQRRRRFHIGDFRFQRGSGGRRRRFGHGQEAGFPEVAEEVAADEFDFFGIIAGGGFDEFNGFIMGDAQGDGRDVALVLVAGQEELLVSLLDPGFFEFKASLILVGFVEGGDVGEQFDEVFMGEFLAGIGLEGLEKALGGEGGVTGGQATSSASESAGVTGIFLEEFERDLFGEPVLEAGGAPVGEVLGGDGGGGEFGIEDYFDGGKPVEPGEEVGSGLMIADTAVELFAEGVRETGNFAGDETGGSHKRVESGMS
jgi:hypothetical protein